MPLSINHSQLFILCHAEMVVAQWFISKSAFINAHLKIKKEAQL